MKKIGIILGATVLVFLIGIGIYRTFFQGCTNGPDFITALHAGSVSAPDLSSIEVLEPPVGHMPFTEPEYAELGRSVVIRNQPEMSHFLIEIKRSAVLPLGPLNHPVTTYNGYCKVTLNSSGFYYLYVKVLSDGARQVCEVSANTQNATNPNNAKDYVLVDINPLLALLESRDHAKQPNQAAHATSPKGSEHGR